MEGRIEKVCLEALYLRVAFGIFRGNTCCMMKIVLLSGFLFFLVALAGAQADTSLHEYKGVYKFPEGSATPSVEISIQNGSLYANSSIGSATLTRIAKDTFSIPEHNGMAYFSRNGDGKVKGIRVEVGDLLLEGDKEPAANAWLQRRRWVAMVK